MSCFRHMLLVFHCEWLEQKEENLVFLGKEYLELMKTMCTKKHVVHVLDLLIMMKFNLACPSKIKNAICSHNMSLIETIPCQPASLSSFILPVCQRDKTATYSTWMNTLWFELRPHTVLCFFSRWLCVDGVLPPVLLCWRRSVLPRSALCCQ